VEGHSFTQEAKLYAKVLAALLVLTAVTVAAAGVDFGSPSVNVVIALLIASTKASLVALFFMHLLYDRPLNALIFVVGVLMLAIFLIFTLIDVDTRPVIRPSRLPAAAPQASQVEAPKTP